MSENNNRKNSKASRKKGNDKAKRNTVPEALRPRSVAGQIVEYTEEERKVQEQKRILHEDNLELAAMTRKERRAVKKERREKEMEGMTRGQRIKYLLYYYQWPIIVTTLTAGCLIWILIAVLRSEPPVALSAAVMNNDRSKEVTSEIFDTYIREANINPSYRTVVESFQINLETLQTDINAATADSAYVRFPNLARESYFDIIITDRGGLDYCSTTDIAIYPDYVLPMDLLEALKPYEVEAEDYYNQTFVYAYDISGTDFAKSLDLGYDEIFLCFPGNTSEAQMHAENFVRYIFNVPRKEQ